MFRDLELGPGDTVLELGPGTGSFTVEVEQRRRSGIAMHYLGIERDKGMYDFLVHRFPELKFVLGDVVDIAEICAEHGFPPATAVISSLPLLLMDRQTLDAVFADTRRYMESKGTFRAFSYVHCYPTRRAKGLRSRMNQAFDEITHSGPVFRNLPPAMVITGRGPKVA